MKTATKTWVPISVVTKLTSWNKEFMRRARENDIIKFKEVRINKNGKEVRQIKYLLQSIPEIFIIKKP